MKITKARNNSGDDWKTPDSFYNKLNEIYHFDFDPCPYQSDFDGLKIEWGKANFVNPPYSRKLKEAFIVTLFPNVNVFAVISPTTVRFPVALLNVKTGVFPRFILNISVSFGLILTVLTTS